MTPMWTSLDTLGAYTSGFSGTSPRQKNIAGLGQWGSQARDSNDDRTRPHGKIHKSHRVGGHHFGPGHLPRSDREDCAAITRLAREATEPRPSA